MRILEREKRAKLVSVCDTDAGSLARAAVRAPGVAATTDYREVLANSSVDAVVVCTPAATHADIAGEALVAGKHVLCEKPLALTTLDCDNLIAAGSVANRVLMIGHTFLFNPAVRLMRECLAAGTVGRIFYCHSVRTGPGPVRPGLNALWDLAPHDLSMILYLLDGEPLDVCARGLSCYRPRGEDVVFLTLRLAGDILAHIHVSWIDAVKVRRFTVVGEERVMWFDDLGDPKLGLVERSDSGAPDTGPVLDARGRLRGTRPNPPTTLTSLIPKDEPLAMQVAHFATCCLDGTQPETSAIDGRRVVSILEHASQSLASRGEAVDVEASIARVTVYG